MPFTHSGCAVLCVWESVTRTHKTIHTPEHPATHLPRIKLSCLWFSLLTPPRILAQLPVQFNHLQNLLCVGACLSNTHCLAWWCGDCALTSLVNWKGLVNQKQCFPKKQKSGVRVWPGPSILCLVTCGERPVQWTWSVTWQRSPLVNWESATQEELRN